MTYRTIPLIVALVLICFEVTAQSRISGNGVQFGSILGQTNLPDNDYSLYARAFMRQDFSMAFQGEASIGLGFINGVQYRTRLIPLEYRFHYKPYKGRKLWAFNSMNFEPFLFTGFGALYYSPVEVSAGDDPLTVEAGPSLPGSSYWDYSRGFTGFVPMGAGVEIGLEGRNQMVITAGYNQSMSDHITGMESGFANGYWGITAGIKFNRPKKRKVVAARAYKTRTIAPSLEITLPEKIPVDYSELDQITKVNLDDLHFHSMSAELTSNYQSGLDRIHQILKKDESIHLKIHGHTDDNGEERMNRSLSEERAWATALYLIEKGIAPERFNIVGHGSSQPIADNTIEAGRAENRRVKVDAQRVNPEDNQQPVSTTERLTPVEAGSALIPAGRVEFIWTTSSFLGNSKEPIEALAGTLQENPGWEILITSRADQRKGAAMEEFLSKARAERIRRELMQYGIPFEKIHTARFDEVPGEYDHLIPETEGQATVIIRLR